ncbi:flagellar biosynthetic protein FliR [Endobacter medicaginis]|uniref:Flagellar biosynthetic protein FliR n=1 Tax=Endobacter medicaginis TaxID=1181271 RepID=A0A850NKW5_9PROT|nr:flagellar biosynthetic protein FliR [Endobacter medicaginis]MBB3172686.1 flagellar biosynthetic protein FliR [Endobacter medicaginis]NVN29554.1 flagellar biosynthetic protein FliR [Endobacter medicaginis]
MPVLGALTPLAFGFMLTVCRVSAAVMLLPGLGESEAPITVRAGLALAMSLVLMPAVLPLLPDPPGAPAALLALVAGELLAGGVLGWLARLIGMALPIAGQLMSTMIGLASVLNPDPALGAQTTGLSRMMSLAVPVLVLVSGLYTLPISALAGSYHLLAPGFLLSGPPRMGDMAAEVTEATARAFALALQLAAPFVIAAALLQTVIGVLGRLVPSMQVGNFTAPLQLLGGLLLSAMLISSLVGVWTGAVQSGWGLLPGSGAG